MQASEISCCYVSESDHWLQLMTIRNLDFSTWKELEVMQTFVQFFVFFGGIFVFKFTLLEKSLNIFRHSLCFLNSWISKHRFYKNLTSRSDFFPQKQKNSSKQLCLSTCHERSNVNSVSFLNKLSALVGSKKWQ